MKTTEEQGLMATQRMKWIKKLDDNLYELRSKQSSNIQRAIYFQKEQNKYLITHGFTKKQEKTPLKEIKHAKMIRKKYWEGKIYE